MSTVAAIRAKLVEWAEALDWSGLSGALTVRAEAPLPTDGVDDLPTLALWFAATSRSFAEPTRAIEADDGAIGWDCGHKDSALELLFRLGSYEDAEAVRDVFERSFVAACVAGYGPHDGLANVARSGNLAWSLELSWDELLAPSTVTDEDAPRIGMTLYWDGDDDLETPAETGVRGLFELRYSIGVAYPWIERVGAPEVWDISIENDEPSGSTFVFDLDDYEGEA